MINYQFNDKIDDNIFSEYGSYKQLILELSKQQDVDKCLDKLMELWGYINRFRNCDLGLYFDEDIHKAILALNKKDFSMTNRYNHGNELNICFMTDGFSTTGGASLPHRFILNLPMFSGYKLNTYLAVSNLGCRDNYENTPGYIYARDQLNIKEIFIVPPIHSFKEKGELLQSWLLENEIDILLLSPDPATLYMLGSNPVNVVGILSQDCYCWTVGPGVGDITFLVTLDQIFKYKFKEKNQEHDSSVIMLPMHELNYINNRSKLFLSEYGVPDNAIVTASTNIWKSCAGDYEGYLECLAYLIRKYKNLHHLFIGTKRSLDFIDFYLNKNEDIENNIHYVGVQDNIYSVLESVDIYLNSFPTSGGSNIEAAMLGVPSVELVVNRNLNLHGCEFMHSWELTATNIEEYKNIACKLIEDENYRIEMGNYSKKIVSREFDKKRLLQERLYKPLIEKYKQKNSIIEFYKKNIINCAIEYEKYIGYYDRVLLKKATFIARENYLFSLYKKYPKKVLAAIRLLELAFELESIELTEKILKKIDESILLDYRAHLLLSLIYLGSDNEKSLFHINRACKLTKFSKLPLDIRSDIVASINGGNDYIFDKLTIKINNMVDFYHI